MVSPLFRELKMLFFDFDGVLTDNRVSVSSRGDESVVCSKLDGPGFRSLEAMGISVAVLSTERNEVVSTRCRKLGVDCYQGVDDKQRFVLEFVEEHGDLEIQNLGLVGNDVNDIGALEVVGYPFAVIDATDQVLKTRPFVIPVAGGQGVVRYMADTYLL